MDEDNSGHGQITPKLARELLASLPNRPKRRLGLRDHLSGVSIIILSLLSGVIALAGAPWWAILPAVGALSISVMWFTGRRAQANEPRFTAAIIPTSVFNTLLILPIWRGITSGDTAPFPESLILAGLAPAVWLVYYVILLVRR